MKSRFVQNTFTSIAGILIPIFLMSSCRSINPGAAPGPSPVPPTTTSEVNVPLKIPKQTLSDLINQRIPHVLLDGKGMDMGNGILGDIKLTKNGIVTWSSLDSQRIEITLPIRIQGEVGLKNKGLGSLFQAKVPLDEVFNPVFIIDPVINPDWSLAIRQFELSDLGGKLGLDILGMNVDLSGLLGKEIQKWGNANLTAKESVASFKPLVDGAWNQAGKPFIIDWIEGKRAFSIQPESVRLKEFFDTDQNLVLLLGLDGRVNSHPAEAMPSRAFPLPKISPNENRENQLSIVMPLSVSYAQLDELLKDNLEGKVVRIDKKTTLIPSNLKTRAFGKLIGITMDFFAEQTNGKSLNGSLFIVGKPGYDEESQSLNFSDVNFKLESGNFGAQTSVGLKKRKIIRQMERRAVFPIGDVLEESLINIRERLNLETPIANLRIADLTIGPDGFYPTANGLVIHMKALGKVDVHWK